METCEQYLEESSKNISKLRKEVIAKLRNVYEFKRMFKTVFEDAALLEYNWPGRFGKPAIQNLMVVWEVMFPVYSKYEPSASREEFASRMIHSVKMARNRATTMRIRANNRNDI